MTLKNRYPKGSRASLETVLPLLFLSLSQLQAAFLGWHRTMGIAPQKPTRSQAQSRSCDFSQEEKTMNVSLHLRSILTSHSRAVSGVASCLRRPSFVSFLSRVTILPNKGNPLFVCAKITSDLQQLECLN